MKRFDGFALALFCTILMSVAFIAKKCELRL